MPINNIFYLHTHSAISGIFTYYNVTDKAHKVFIVFIWLKPQMSEHFNVSFFVRWNIGDQTWELHWEREIQEFYSKPYHSAHKVWKERQSFLTVSDKNYNYPLF